MPPPPARGSLVSRLRRSLRILRKSCTGNISFLVNAIAFGFVWLCFPLENKFYQKFIRNRTFYFPQVNPRHLRPLDWVRIFFQVLFLLIFFISKDKASQRKRGFSIYRWIAQFRIWATRFVKRLSEKFSKGLVADVPSSGVGLSGRRSLRLKRVLAGFLICMGLMLYVLCITQPFSLEEQIVFLLILWLIALVLFQAKTRLTLLMLIVISVIVSSRYIWWRYTETINPNSWLSVFFSWLLIFAETYAFIVMLLGYFQVCWVLDRKPTSLPLDKSLWPHVDVLIPTYNEPLDVVKPTVYAAMTMNWPKEKLHVHILDDGTRKEFEEFAKGVGANYIIRQEHKHAKAGNINHALSQTHAEFVAIFDCDHVPVKTFLTRTMGWFLRDKSIALVQTPHHFYSKDPFEKNLHLGDTVPNENSLFHDFIQKGNDTWNSTMFCGSCAIMRRKALEEVGGIALETVTEDAHTSLKLNRKGWTSAFLSIPLSAGLSTETLASHIGQRIRWARGMIQIFRLDNPLFGKGLTIPQRLCFLNAMIHFLHGLPRIVFLLAPLPFLFADIYVIYASAIAIFVYLVPHMVHATMTTYIIHKGYRFPFVSALYETILSWYIFLPTLVAIFAPHRGKFNVTTKGGVIDSSFLDWAVAKPYLWLLLFNLAGFVCGIYKMIGAAEYEMVMLSINMGWIIYNLIILFAAVAVSVESVQQRKFPRIAAILPVELKDEKGDVYKASVCAFSQKDCQVAFKNPSLMPNMKLGDTAEITFGAGTTTAHTFKVFVIGIFSAGVIDFEMVLPTLNDEMAYTECTFGTPDIWIQKQAQIKGYGMLDGFMALLKMARQGVDAFVDYSPKGLGWLFKGISKTTKWLISFLPRWPKLPMKKKFPVFTPHLPWM
ncbi:MAG: UDP-forming cellulose synthase catalytic subunit [Burkholderiales bacterium]|nr:UDP-forming cellulose synthase catalytic subunit [Burkholderiales bacterium]